MHQTNSGKSPKICFHSYFNTLSVRYDPSPGPVGGFLKTPLSAKMGGGGGGTNMHTILTPLIKGKGGWKGNLQACVPGVITTAIEFKLRLRMFWSKSFSKTRTKH